MPAHFTQSSESTDSTESALSARTHLLALEPFAMPPASLALTIDAGAELLPGGELRLCYILQGDIGQVLLPPPGAPMRVDGLWRHTCCEVFIGVPGSRSYREFNFSPSSAWAAYAFADYRQAAGQPLGEIPPIACLRNDNELKLLATLSPGWLPEPGPLCVGLSAVVETTDGTLGYWALAHPAAQPDFHHRDSFILTLTESP